MFASFERNHAFIFHVTFVANQNNLCIVPRICFDLCTPETEKTTTLIYVQNIWVTTKIFWSIPSKFRQDQNNTVKAVSTSQGKIIQNR